MARVKYYDPATDTWKPADDISTTYPIVTGTTQLLPERYHAFGEVGSLNLELVEINDGNAHEYFFEFIPSNDFTGLTITPAPTWVSDPQYPAGKTCQVSILRGIGVMICA